VTPHLQDGEEITTLSFFVLIQYRRVTDGRTRCSRKLARAGKNGSPFSAILENTAKYRKNYAFPLLKFRLYDDTYLRRIDRWSFWSWFDV